MDQRKPQMAFRAYGSNWEVHLLNPGDFFPGFGGSRAGLKVGKTASLVIRELSPWGRKDTEYEVNSDEAWGVIQKLIADSALGKTESQE